jgi:hypothetical protein
MAYPTAHCTLTSKTIGATSSTTTSLGNRRRHAFSECQSFMSSQDSPGRPMSNGMERIGDTVVAILERVTVMLSCTNAPVAKVFRDCLGIGSPGE